MLKKLTPLLVLLCLSLAVSSSCPILTILLSHITSEVQLNADQAAAYLKYEVNVPDSFSASDAQQSVMNFVLTQSELTEVKPIGDITAQFYSSATLADYLYDCAEITEISMLNTALYISYCTHGTEEIWLCYNNNGLLNKVVYDNATDIAVETDRGITTQLNNFRTG